MNSLTLSEIDELFFYDGKNLLWKNDLKYGSHKKAGEIAGSIANNGYMRVGLKRSGIRKMYTVHRIVYQIANRVDKIDDNMIVDHIDTDPLNNCIENLRVVTRGQNNLNCKLRKDNKLGYKNICKEYVSSVTGEVNIYRVNINFMKRVYTVFARSIPEAVEKRDKIMRELFLEYARSESGKIDA